MMITEYFDRNGVSVSKIQTVHANRNFINEATEDKTLYLNENRKETKRWFETLNAQMPFSGEHRLGFIRMLSQNKATVNFVLLEFLP